MERQAVGAGGVGLLMLGLEFENWFSTSFIDEESI